MVLVLTYCDKLKDSNFLLLIRSLEKFGYDYEVLSAPKPFSFKKMIQCFVTRLEEISDRNQLICKTDALDTLFFAPPSELEKKYDQLTESKRDKLVVTVTYTENILGISKFPSTKHWFFHRGIYDLPRMADVNSGVIVAPVYILLECYKWMLSKELPQNEKEWDDQVQLSKYICQYPETVVIDTSMEISAIQHPLGWVWNLSCERFHFDKKKKRYKCLDSGSYPTIMHSNVMDCDHGWRYGKWASQLFDEFLIPPKIIWWCIFMFFTTILFILVTRKKSSPWVSFFIKTLWVGGICYWFSPYFRFISKMLLNVKKS